MDMKNILGYKLKAAREALGLSIEDLATLATLSKKQITQIENGGEESFYSTSIKYVAVHKVAKILQLSEDDYLETLESPKSAKEDLVSERLIDPIVKNTTAKEPEKVEPNTTSEPRVSKNIFTKGFGVYILAATLLFLMVRIFDQVQTDFKGLHQSDNDSLSQNEVDQKSQSTANIPVSKSEQLENVVLADQLFATNPCPIIKNNIPKYQPLSASRSGNQVYVVPKSYPIIICFEDARGNTETKQLAPNIGANFIGKAPFTLSSKSLDQADIFFQGYKVKADLSQQGLILEEKLILD